MSNQSSSQPYIPHVLSVIGEESEPATASSQSHSNSNSRSRASSTNDIFRSFPDFKSIDDAETLSSPSSRDHAPSTKPPSSLQHVPTISSMSSRSSGQPSSIPTIPSQYSARQTPALETPAFSNSPFVAFDQPSTHSRSNSASDNNGRAGNLIAFFESGKEKEKEKEKERDPFSSPPISKVIQTKRPINLNRNKDDNQPPQRPQAQIQPAIPSLPSPTRLESLTDGWETMISSSAPTDSSTPLTSHKTPLTSQRPTSPIDLSSFDDITEQVSFDFKLVETF